MKSLLEIYKDIFQKLEKEKSSHCVETKMLCQAAEGYVENLQNFDRWKYIIKTDIEDLKASSQMQRNLLNNSDKLDRNAVGIGERYIMGIDIFLVMVSHEMERYGLIIDGIEGLPVPETIQSAIVPDDEAGNNASLITEENNKNGADNDIPSEIMLLFKNDLGKINELKNKTKSFNNIVKDTAYYLDQCKDLDKQYGWKKNAFDYFVWPHYKGLEEKYNNVLKRFRNALKY